VIKWSCTDAKEQVALDGMSLPAQRFLFGIAHGYVPTSDGLFTYHAHGATPVHYRHNMGSEPSTGDGIMSRPLCGKWTWSPDRKTWFPTNTHDITRGTFGNGGWCLVHDNRAIVNFLEMWPIVPFFAGELFIQNPGEVTTSHLLNEACINDFMVAVGTGPRPTTTCIEINAFTIHFHLLPALILTCNEQGWKMDTSMHNKVLHGAVSEFEKVLQLLNRRRASTDFEGVDHRPLPPLSDYIHQYEHWFRQTTLPELFLVHM
jgi:hypothetical protein